MFCFACGQDLPDVARFCSQCGTNLYGVATRPTNEEITGRASKAESTVPAEIIDNVHFEDTTEARTTFGSRPFGFDIIEHFRDELPFEYKDQVRKRLSDAAKIHEGTTYVPFDAFPVISESTFLVNVGDLAFFFKKVNELFPYLKPTTQLLMELLVRVYMRG